MAHAALLPAPEQLDIHNAIAAELWKEWEGAWKHYARATGLSTKEEAVQVSTLLTVIGPQARRVFSTFQWNDPQDEEKIGTVLAKFAAYCRPRKNVPFERYRFYKREQQTGESLDQYATALRQLANHCDFENITPDEILRDRILFGITDGRVREALLRKDAITLVKVLDVCRAAELSHAQIREFDGKTLTGDSVNAIQKSKKNSKLRQKTTQQKSDRSHECRYCGTSHEFKKELCPAYGKRCAKCGRENHYARKCQQKGIQKSVRLVDESSAVEDAVYQVKETAREQVSDRFVTLRLRESGNYMKFQLDTGAECNVIPLRLYKKATGDFQLKKITSCNDEIVAFGGSKLKLAGRVLLPVSRGDTRCTLRCNLIDANVHPLLGRKACVGMQLIRVLDSDDMNRPDTGSRPVFAIRSAEKPLSKQQLAMKFPNVFSDKAGKLEGEYHIKLDPSVDPVQHAPRRVQVALRAKLCESLDEMVKDEVLAPVTEPTPWISSMVIVAKKNGKLRICLDPKDLNKAVRREHYQLPTIEDVATRLHGAKVFTILDVRTGFWHICLDEESSKLTTFNTPFGRYRWKRMPFGLSCAPEVFQRKMHELIEGLAGVEVIADDFAVVGCGSDMESAIQDHEQNLLKFLERCEKRNIRLNLDKLQLRQSEVPFIGHVASGEGLKIHPDKVKAIMEMPEPKDVQAVQRLIGMVTYLTKFVPRLTEILEPLRELVHQDTEWEWSHPQKRAFEKVKAAISSAPVLRYYCLEDEVTIQCDASQSGLGAALIQQGQPVAFASRAMTSAETRYAQIEKELLAIVYACEKFDGYVYGREEITIQSDHKPLESIFKKPLNTAPMRLQRMLLRLQRYNLRVVYHRGKEMFLADTLSRAYLPVNICDELPSVESINPTVHLPVSAERLQQIKHATAEDPSLALLREVIQVGWPEEKRSVPHAVQPFWDCRDELVVHEQLIFKGQRLVIPACMRTEMMAVTHASHVGIEGCLRRARECLFWPYMSQDMKKYISTCDVCQTHQTSQQKEPLRQHEVITRPWAKLGVDLCELHGRTLIVVCDYFSNYLEVESLKTVTSRAVIRQLTAMFARHGIPDVVVSDNGPQFASAEFASFAKRWRFEHVTSSPRYAQSNGKAENAVQTVKRLFTKCKQDGTSEFLALLDWRNTPSEGMGVSPSQRLMGRRCKTLLPMTSSLLQPRHSAETDSHALLAAKAKQEYYYNMHAQPLPTLKSGASVRIRLPGQKIWTPGTCERNVGPRSYEVQVGGSTYRRNRRDIRKSSQEPPLTAEFETSEVPVEQREQQEVAHELPSEQPTVMAETAEKCASPTVRRSGRARRANVRLQDYEYQSN